jgi:hypothetical protein
MKLRFVPFLLLCLSFVAFASQPSFAGGCGWDYPCPPEPSFGRPDVRASQVTIHNNYGNVNIYTSRRRASQAPAFPDYDAGPCRDETCLRTGCGGYPCTDRCGPLCWMRRARQGYCGHGCQSYLGHARIEAEERAEWKEEHGIPAGTPPSKDEWMYEKHTECAPPYCPQPEFDAPPPPPEPPAYYYNRRTPERDYDAPPPARESFKPDLTPRGRFEGPRYPAK